MGLLLNTIFLILYQSMLLKSPNIFGNHISFLIKTNIKSVRQIFMVLSRLLPYFSRLMKYQGIRIQLKGRMNGSKRTRVNKAQYGNIPLSTVSKNIYYSFNKIMTIHGVYSLKIWYYI
jgi:ribosomal protein S3